MAIEGKWKLFFSTPAGDQQPVVTFSFSNDKLQGVCHNSATGEDTELDDIEYDEDWVSWSLETTQPKPGIAKFDMELNDDNTMTGKMKMGKFPIKFTVEGEKIE